MTKIEIYPWLRGFPEGTLPQPKDMFRLIEEFCVRLNSTSMIIAYIGRRRNSATENRLIYVV